MIKWLNIHIICALLAWADSTHFHFQILPMFTFLLFTFLLSYFWNRIFWIWTPYMWVRYSYFLLVTCYLLLLTFKPIPPTSISKSCHFLPTPPTNPVKRKKLVSPWVLLYWVSNRERSSAIKTTLLSLLLIVSPPRPNTTHRNPFPFSCSPISEHL